MAGGPPIFVEGQALSITMSCGVAQSSCEEKQLREGRVRTRRFGSVFRASAPAGNR